MVRTSCGGHPDGVPGSSLTASAGSAATTMRIANLTCADCWDQVLHFVIFCSATCNVEALQRVTVPGCLVAAAVDGARNGLDAESSVVHGVVARQDRRFDGGRPDEVDSVADRVADHVLLDQRVGDEATGFGANRDSDSRDDHTVVAKHVPCRRAVPRILEIVDLDAVAWRVDEGVSCN